MVPLGVLGTGLAFVLMTTLVGRVGGPRGSIAIYFTPIVAIALGVAVARRGRCTRSPPSAACWSSPARGSPHAATTLPASPAGRA